jgi:ribosome-binding factor A
MLRNIYLRFLKTNPSEENLQEDYQNIKQFMKKSKIKRLQVKAFIEFIIQMDKKKS